MLPKVQWKIHKPIQQYVSPQRFFSLVWLIYWPMQSIWQQRILTIWRCCNTEPLSVSGQNIIYLWRHKMSGGMISNWWTSLQLLHPTKQMHILLKHPQKIMYEKIAVLLQVFTWCSSKRNCWITSPSMKWWPINQHTY